MPRRSSRTARAGRLCSPVRAAALPALGADRFSGSARAAAAPENGSSAGRCPSTTAMTTGKENVRPDFRPVTSKVSRQFDATPHDATVAEALFISLASQLGAARGTAIDEVAQGHRRSGFASEAACRFLRLLQPKSHAHLAAHRRGCREVFAGVLTPAHASVELAEAEVTVGEDRAHAELVG